MDFENRKRCNIVRLRIWPNAWHYRPSPTANSLGGPAKGEASSYWPARPTAHAAWSPRPRRHGGTGIGGEVGVEAGCGGGESIVGGGGTRWARWGGRVLTEAAWHR
jgi:hypothetical protein